jgi:hypothetical protein
MATTTGSKSKRGSWRREPGSALQSAPPDLPGKRSISGSPTLDSEMLEKLVREAAYFRAERRGFAPGMELADWLAAEQEVDRLLGGGTFLPLGFVDHARVGN